MSSFFRQQLKDLDVARFNCAKYTDVSFELLEAIKLAQQNTCQAYIKGDVYVEFDEEADMCLPEPQGALEKLNKLCWSHRVVRPDGSVFKIMNDLDCIIIENRRAEMAKNPKKTDPIVYLSEIDLDLKTNKVKLLLEEQRNNEPDELTIERVPDNDRSRRKGHRKADGAPYSNPDDYIHELNKFGNNWFEKNKKKNPSLQ